MKILPVAIACMSISWAASPAFAQDARTDLPATVCRRTCVPLAHGPAHATGDGVHDYDDRLPSVTPAAQEQRVAADQGFLQRLRAIDRGH